MDLLLQAITSGLQIGLLYALVAIGLTIIWGLMETINFGHGELMMLGMFGAWWFTTRFGLDPLVMIIPVGLLIYGLGWLIYEFLMKPVQLQGGEVFTQMFATFGLAIFMQNGAVAIFSSDPRFIQNTVLQSLGGVNVELGSLRVDTAFLVGGLIALALFLALYVVIDRTELGLALQATSEDREAAILVGVKPTRMFALAWGGGAALVAIAGVILANFYAIFPQIGLEFTILAYAIVALGGFGSVGGTLVAALLVGVVQSVTALYLDPAFKDAFVFSSYILVGLFRPQGLFGRF